MEKIELEKYLRDKIIVHYLSRKKEKKEEGKLVAIAKNGIVIGHQHSSYVSSLVLGFNEIYLITDQRGKEIYSAEINDETGRVICFSDLIFEDDKANDLVAWNKRIDDNNKALEDRQVSLLEIIKRQLPRKERKVIKKYKKRLQP